MCGRSLGQRVGQTSTTHAESESMLSVKLQALYNAPIDSDSIRRVVLSYELASFMVTEFSPTVISQEHVDAEIGGLMLSIDILYSLALQFSQRWTLSFETLLYAIVVYAKFTWQLTTSSTFPNNVVMNCFFADLDFKIHNKKTNSQSDSEYAVRHEYDILSASLMYAIKVLETGQIVDRLRTRMEQCFMCYNRFKTECARRERKVWPTEPPIFVDKAKQIEFKNLLDVTRSNLLIVEEHIFLAEPKTNTLNSLEILQNWLQWSKFAYDFDYSLHLPEGTGFEHVDKQYPLHLPESPASNKEQKKLTSTEVLPAVYATRAKSPELVSDVTLGKRCAAHPNTPDTVPKNGSTRKGKKRKVADEEHFFRDSWILLDNSQNKAINHWTW